MITTESRVAGVFDNFYGLPLKPPGIEVLDGSKLGPSDVLGRSHYPLCLDVGGRAVAIPGSDATSQDALDGAAVEPFEDLRTHVKYFSVSSFQSHALIMTVLVCLVHVSLWVMWMV